MERIGVCASCGARFKIPESFQGSSAPCKKCDGVIKIGPASAAAAAAPAPKAAPAAKPAAAPARATPAKAAPARPAARRAEDEETVIDRPARSSSKRPARAEAAPAAGRRGRRGGGGDSEKKKSPMVLVGAIAGGLILVGVVGFMMMNGKDEPSGDPATAKSTDTAANPAGGASGTTDAAGVEAAKPAPEKPTDPAATEKAPTPEAPTDAGSGATGDGAAPAGGSDAAPGETPNPDGEVDTEVHSKFEFTAIDRAPGTTDEEWAELSKLAERLKDSGAPRKRALKALVPFGIKAVPVCINSLNGLDLTDANDWKNGFEIAQFIQDDLTFGTIMIPYHGDFSSETAKINRNHEVLTSILDFWNKRSADPVLWEALLKKYEGKKAGGSSDE
ncbi:MAG: hypothetical protein JNL90_02985 [Planctomycetes bacterium]|nr:hypothetical protein [Planctomycetota bacterium]